MTLLILMPLCILIAIRLYIHRWWRKLSDEEKAEITRGTQRIPGDW
jgi:hypothetical protein